MYMKVKKQVFLLCLTITIAAVLRFYNLMHDSPYFFDPDERNMAIAITQFKLPANLTRVPVCLMSEFSISKNRVKSPDCSLNPHFFAYSQFPLYLSYVSDQTVHLISSIFNNLRIAKTNINTNEILITTFPAAVFWLRFWSALSSTLTVYFVYLISKKLLTTYYSLLATILTVFTPGLIQAAHFGTTESLLTMLFLASIYFSIRLYEENTRKMKSAFGKDLKIIIWLGLSIGVAIGSKLTGIFFLIPPLSALIASCNQLKLKTLFLLRKLIFQGILILVTTLIVIILTSPYNLVEWRDFQSAVFGYEKDVATGVYPAFYTTQFVDTTPIIFQAQKIFPYVLGWPVFILGTLGFLITSLQMIHLVFVSIIRRIKNLKSRIQNKKEKIINSRLQFFILNSTFLIYFLPNAFLYAKWTRFMTPILPFFAIFSGYFISVILRSVSDSRINDRIEFKDSGQDGYQTVTRQARMTIKLGYWFIGLLVIIGSITPGLAFMSIYTHPDTRLQASYWIYDNIPDNSYVLSETANVVDIPLGIPDYNLKPNTYNLNVISFDFYHLDENPLIFERLLSELEKADFIFIPSRRLFANYTRLANKYPRLNRYYQLLFSGALGFTKVAEISSFPSLLYPTINLQPITYNLQPLLTFPDERSEETYTVFDHPVVRIYKKTRPLTIYEYEYLLKS